MTLSNDWFLYIYFLFLQNAMPFGQSDPASNVVTSGPYDNALIDMFAPDICVWVFCQGP